MQSLYHIRVVGQLDRRWTKFAELAVSEDRDPRGMPVTCLEGRVRDQAALLGILNALYSWHHVLLSVQCLDESEPRA